MLLYAIRRWLTFTFTLHVMSSARIDLFTRGRIIGQAEAGSTASTIAMKVRKTDGTRIEVRSVQKVISKFKKNPKGVMQPQEGGPGRPPKMTDFHRRLLVRLVFRERGAAWVTIKYCQQRLPCLRRYSRWAMTYALHSAGLLWLRRRRKKWVPARHRQPRLAWARWVLRQPPGSLKAFVYIDGTTFYLARGVHELEDQARRRLGQFTWRMSSAADGLFNDNVGASLYAAKQGLPVKLWGFLANGKLCYHILPAADEAGETTHMNGIVFRSMMERWAERWTRACWPSRKPRVVRMVMDYEKCLRSPDSLQCLRENGITVVTQHPKSSPDLNAIENVWFHFRARLDETAPARTETRENFILRLRAAVRHLNTAKRSVLVELCFDQTKRAHLVVANDGGRINM